ncbi:MAG: fibronectin type III domain-containing protein, partial [Verrucomicrobiota bacterium]|nr:fibronectin type III domain-containing protein [Verrucomicrobiota bacterium]
SSANDGNAARAAQHTYYSMKKRLCTLFLIPAMLIALPVPRTHAEDAFIDDETATDGTVTNVTLSWDPNTEQNITGYTVYYGRSSGDYFRLVMVSGTTAQIGVKGSRPTYFAVTAVNANGAESDLSDEVQWP